MDNQFDGFDQMPETGKSKKGLFIGIGVAAAVVVAVVIVLCVVLLGGSKVDGKYVANMEGMECTLKIDGDKFKMSMSYGGSEMELGSGKCKVSGNTVKLTMEGETIEAKYNSSKKTITIEDDSEKVVFKKK